MRSSYHEMVRFHTLSSLGNIRRTGWHCERFREFRSFGSMPQVLKTDSGSKSIKLRGTFVNSLALTDFRACCFVGLPTLTVFNKFLDSFSSRGCENCGKRPKSWKSRASKFSTPCGKAVENSCRFSTEYLYLVKVFHPNHRVFHKYSP